MSPKRVFHLIIASTIVVCVAGALTATVASPHPLSSRRQGEGPGIRTLADDPDPPDDPVKLVFVHHSCGDNWLDAGNGGLGDALGADNYYVSDTYYGWGPDDIGSNTDIGHWWTWFRGPSSETYTQALYDTTNQHASYTRPMADPGGENEVILFKSCYPNSELGGGLGDPIPPIDSNPLRGQSCGSTHHTVPNAQGIYLDLLNYFETRQDKLFIAVTAPPRVEGNISPDEAANARDFNDWLVNDWLDDYAYDNVAVFDFFNVLTSNGGSPDVNDLGETAGNHHRWWNGAVQHIHTVDNDFGAYADDHPNAAGNQKATGEFVDLLNVFYNRWQGDDGTPTATATATGTATATPTPTDQQVVIFQNGVSPDASYVGTTDATITTWSGNSYANLGGLDYLQVGETGDADEFRLLVRFELGGWLPPDASVDEAQLELRAYDSGYDDDPQDAVAHGVTEEWVEGDGGDLMADGRSEGVTWTTARPGVNWATPGGDFDPTELDRVTVAANPDGWYRWDVTSAVRGWVSDGTPNDGLLLEPDNGPWAHHQFRSSECGTATLRPRLVVTYTAEGAATPTPTPTDATPTATLTPTPAPTDTPPPAADHCPALPSPSGLTVTVSTEAELRDQAYKAAPGTTILVEPGTYNLQDAVWVVNDGVTIRGAGGDRDDVILDGGGMLTWTHTHVIAIDADDVTIANLTIRNGDEHGISVQGSDRPTLYNLHILDTGYQLVKVNPVGDGSEDGLLACSSLEYTTASPEEYTNGISAHDAHGWMVRDNAWYRIRTPRNTPVPTILFWSGSSDTVVERNLLVDCYQGISFGNASHGAGDHTGGIVRNNFIYASMPHDVVVEMVHATDWLVAHNTALLLNPDGVTWGMEARYADTTGAFAYNLTSMDIINRDSSGATLTDNVTTADSSWFVDAAVADLHLRETVTAAIDQAATLGQVPDDYDGDPRPVGSAPDIGADEVSSCHQADVDCDGDVDVADIQAVADLWRCAEGDGCYDARYDVNDDGVIDILDIMLVAAYWGLSSSDGALIQPDDLTYQGAFAYPPPGDEWAYSGHALAYYPDGDPNGPADGYPGSLYAAAHAWYDLVGEFSIPEPVMADNFEDLPTASVLQARADITGGWKDNCTYNDDCIYREVDGLIYLPNVDKIAWNLRDWYNAGGYDQDSLGWSDLDMTGAPGVWHIGERPSANDEFHNGKTCNYLFKAPESFADQYLDGKWLIAGNHRGAGAFGGSQGPTLYALAPWEDGDPPTSGQTLDALALLYYPESFDCVYNDPSVCYFPGYRAKDDWGGGAWVEHGGKSGVLIVGRKGLGDSCYGTPEECGGDPCDASKGYHAYPYEPQILFYDPEELREVLAGSKEPWEVLPYQVYRPMDEVLDSECATLGAAAYDRERGVMYVTEQEAGPWGETVVHVWQVE